MESGGLEKGKEGKGIGLDWKGTLSHGITLARGSGTLNRSERGRDVAVSNFSKSLTGWLSLRGGRLNLLDFITSVVFCCRLLFTRGWW